MSLPDPQSLALARSCRAPTSKRHDREETLHQAWMEAPLRPSVALPGPECKRQGGSTALILHRSSRKCAGLSGQVGPLGLGWQRMQHNQGCWSALLGTGEPMDLF